MLEIIAWVAAGILTGWIVALFIEGKLQSSQVPFLVSGGLGGFLGGFIAQSYQTSATFSSDRIVYAIVGALVVTSIIGFVSSKS